METRAKSISGSEKQPRIEPRIQFELLRKDWKDKRRRMLWIAIWANLFAVGFSVLTCYMLHRIAYGIYLAPLNLLAVGISIRKLLK